MEIRVTGAGGRGGWPQPHCRCASCERARSAGRRRAPAQVLVDGVLRIDSGRTPVCGPDVRHRGDGTGGGDVTAGVAGYRVKRVPGGWDITGPDGGRLLGGNGHGRGRGGGPGAPPAAPATAPRGRASARPCGAGSATARPRGVPALGGPRWGTPRHPELRRAAEPRVTYRAAGPSPAGAQPAADSDWTERVAAHRARRPPWWQTVESVDAAGTLRSGSGAVLFDGAGTWLAAVMDESGAWADGAGDGDGDGDGDAGPGGTAGLRRAHGHVAAKVCGLVEAAPATLQ